MNAPGGAGDLSGKEPAGETPPAQAPVSDREREAPPETLSRRQLIKWLWRVPVLAALIGGGYGVYEAINVHFLKRNPTAAPEFEPVADVAVGTVAAFANVWDELPFELPTGGPGGGPLPALAVRLPGPIPGGVAVDSGVGTASAYLAAFSRVCTHQHCIVVLNRDVDAINFGFNYETDSPKLTCPCHLSVFDPMGAGRAVSGPAILPLPRVRLELRGASVVATGIERA